MIGTSMVISYVIVPYRFFRFVRALVLPLLLKHSIISDVAKNTQFLKVAGSGKKRAHWEA
jgi:hypothetical protein